MAQSSWSDRLHGGSSAPSLGRKPRCIGAAAPVTSEELASTAAQSASVAALGKQVAERRRKIAARHASSHLRKALLAGETIAEEPKAPSSPELKAVRAEELQAAQRQLDEVMSRWDRTTAQLSQREAQVAAMRETLETGAAELRRFRTRRAACDELREPPPAATAGATATATATAAEVWEADEDDGPRERIVELFRVDGHFALIVDTANRVVRVEPSSAAEAAGLVAGDQVIAAEGKPLGWPHRTLPELLASGDVGESLNLTVFRATPAKKARWRPGTAPVRGKGRSRSPLADVRQPNSPRVGRRQQAQVKMQESLQKQKQQQQQQQQQQMGVAETHPATTTPLGWTDPARVADVAKAAARDARAALEGLLANEPPADGGEAGGGGGADGGGAAAMARLLSAVAAAETTATAEGTQGQGLTLVRVRTERARDTTATRIEAAKVEVEKVDAQMAHAEKRRGRATQERNLAAWGAHKERRARDAAAELHASLLAMHAPHGWRGGGGASGDDGDDDGDNDARVERLLLAQHLRHDDDARKGLERQLGLRAGGGARRSVFEQLHEQAERREGQAREAQQAREAMRKMRVGLRRVAEYLRIGHLPLAAQLARLVDAAEEIDGAAFKAKRDEALERRARLESELHDWEARRDGARCAAGTSRRIATPPDMTHARRGAPRDAHALCCAQSPRRPRQGGPSPHPRAAATAARLHRPSRTVASRIAHTRPPSLLLRRSRTSQRTTRTSEPCARRRWRRPTREPSSRSGGSTPPRPSTPGPPASCAACRARCTCGSRRATPRRRGCMSTTRAATRAPTRLPSRSPSCSLVGGARRPQAGRCPAGARGARQMRPSSHTRGPTHSPSRRPTTTTTPPHRPRRRPRPPAPPRRLERCSRSSSRARSF